MTARHAVAPLEAAASQTRMEASAEAEISRLPSTV